MDEEHPGGEEGGEQGVEVERAGIEAVEKSGEGDGAEEEDGDEGGAVVVVEAVTGFEIGVVKVVGCRAGGRPGDGRRRRSSRRRRTWRLARSRGDGGGSSGR